MTTYIKLETLEYPRYEGDIRIEHPEIAEELTGDTFPCPSTYAKVHEGAVPSAVTGKTIFEKPPKCVNGVWIQQWGLKDIPEIQTKVAVLNEESEENKKLRTYWHVADMHINNPNTPNIDEWRVFMDEVNAYRESWPRSGVLPTLPKIYQFDAEGNVLTTDMPGDAPNVIG